MPLTDGSTKNTKELTKCLLSAWQWTFTVGAADHCSPTAMMLNIGQFLDEFTDLNCCVPWLLAYAQALQHMGEAMEGRRWWPMGICFSPQVSLLIDAFITETGAKLMEITSCWSEVVTAEVHCKSEMGPSWM